MSEGPGGQLYGSNDFGNTTGRCLLMRDFRIAGRPARSEASLIETQDLGHLKRQVRGFQFHPEAPVTIDPTPPDLA